MTDSLGEHSRGAANLRGQLDDVKLIASGGMSQIFRARQVSLDRYIVIKKLKEEMLTNPETMQRFRREAKALASVLHQNIAHVYDFIDNGLESYILMEYIEGVDVSTLVQKVGHLPPEIAASILLEVAKGVGYIHAHHLIHRDIKPSNIRITTRGEVKLMDFGIVMDIDNQGLTRPGLMVGSPSYLSPEQVLGDQVTVKADLFLMGICLYEMLTGTRPFKDEQKETVFQRIREAKYVPPREMHSSVPAPLEKIVKKLLQKSPDKRYADVKALIVELERYLGPARSAHADQVILQYLDEEAILAPSIAYTVITEETGPTFKERFPASVLATLALLVGLAFGGGYLLGQMISAPSTPSAVPNYSPPKPLKP